MDHAQIEKIERLRSKSKKPLPLAKQAARVLKANACDCRIWDDCFEEGNGDQVVAELCKLAMRDADLRESAKRNRESVPVAVMTAIDAIMAI